MLRRLAVPVAAALFLLPRLIPVAAWDATPVASPAAANQVELPAMALTPADVPEPGYVLTQSRTSDAAEVAAWLGPYLGMAAVEAEAVLRESGFRRRYDSFLVLPVRSHGPTEARSRRREVGSYVVEYADAAGAAANFARLENERAVPTARDLPGRRTFGEESEITRDTGTVADPAGDLPFVALDIAFRIGPIYAGVALFDYTGAEPTVAEVEALASTLLERVEAVQAGGAPGLGNAVARVEGKGVTKYDDVYLARDGVDFRTYGEPGSSWHPQGMAVPYVYHYRVEIGATPVYLEIRLARLESAADATAWVEEQLRGWAGRSEPVPGARAVGDGSETLAITDRRAPWGTPERPARGYVIGLRVGTDAAWIVVTSQESVPQAEAERLAAAQAACLEGWPCEPIPAPTTAPRVATPAA